MAVDLDRTESEAPTTGNTSGARAFLEAVYRSGVRSLEREDPELLALLHREGVRQQETLALVASCSVAHPSTLACEGSYASNVTAEGYPGARYHAGCVNVDAFESLAIDRARQAFGARYANVQPHTASMANQVVFGALLRPGDTLMGLDLDAGGHLSHGSRVNLSGKFFHAVHYGLTPDGRIDYDRAAEVAREHRPRLIVSGTTAYPRLIDWERFREIADSVGAYLLADITHIAALVIAGEHPSPIDAAHVTTTCTHKQLYGPRGGLILIGKEADTPGPDGKTPLWKAMQAGVFPFLQGAPIVNSIVAKARALGRANTPEFRALAGRIVELARALARAMEARGVRVVSGGTDNHIVVLDVLGSFGVTGAVAEAALERCGLIVNKNRIVGDTKPPSVGSGVRLGTNSLALRGFTSSEMDGCAELIVRCLRAVDPEDDRAFRIADREAEAIRSAVRSLALAHLLPDYPAPADE